MQIIARFFQDHPYQAAYGFAALVFFFLLNELRHFLEKRALRKALTQRFPTGPSLPTPPSPQRAGTATWGGALGVLLIVAGLVYAVPLLQNQAGHSTSAPIAQALTSGTYRGSGTGPLGTSAMTLTLDLLTEPHRVSLSTPLGTFSFSGSLTPESRGR